MVKFDAPLSVLRGFSKKEIEDILSKARNKKLFIALALGFPMEGRHLEKLILV